MGAVLMARTETAVERWWVPGTPVPQGSMRRSPHVNALYHDNAEALHAWRGAVAMLSRPAARRLAITKREPVVVTLTFGIAKGPTVRRHLPAVKPDLDKLTRAVLDALTFAGVLADDGQVVEIRTSKGYVPPGDEGVAIMVAVLAERGTGE